LESAKNNHAPTAISKQRKNREILRLSILVNLINGISEELIKFSQIKTPLQK
jgi:hypothetical protein